MAELLLRLARPNDHAFPHCEEALVSEARRGHRGGRADEERLRGSPASGTSEQMNRYNIRDPVARQIREPCPQDAVSAKPGALGGQKATLKLKPFAVFASLGPT